MEVLKSNVGLAETIATAIATSLEQANSNNGAILSDNQTTVAGNGNAQTAIQAIHNAQNKLIQAIGQASTNLQTVANEFEAVDQAMRKIISPHPLPAPPRSVAK